MFHTLIEAVTSLVSKEKITKGRKCQHSPETVFISQSNSFPLSYLRNLARKFEGKLLLQREIDLREDVFQKLLNESFFTSITSIQKNLLSPICMRCNNKKHSLFGTIPCKRCHQTHLYCRNCLTMGRVMECEPLFYWSGNRFNWPQWTDPCSWRGTLTKAQNHAANEIKKTVMYGGELLVWAVAGAGKTEMLFPGITNALEQGKRVCIATPRKDVVMELVPRFKNAFEQITIQGLYGGSRENDGTAQLIIATTHQLLRYQHAFDLLIIDEIDAFPYHQDATLHFAAERAAKDSASRIYLTATPREIHQSQIASNKLPHVFVPIRFHGYPLPIPVAIKNPSLKKKKIADPFLNWLHNREVPSRQLLIFVPTIQSSKELIKPLSEICVDHEFVSDSHKLEFVHAEDKDREKKITAFRHKEIYILITTTILERGVTFPAVDVVVLDADHIVFDEAALVQIAGRAGRSDNDPKGEVVFFYEEKTIAMVRAIKGIKQMNKRAQALLKGEDK